MVGAVKAQLTMFGSCCGVSPASRPADWTVALLSKMAWPSPPGGPGRGPAAWASDGYSATNSMMYLVSPGFTVTVYSQSGLSSPLPPQFALNGDWTVPG